MNLSSDKLKKELVLGLRKGACFWKEKNSWIFVSSWVVLAGLVFSIWYFWIFSYEWDSSRREAYQKEKGQGVVLDEKKARDILEDMRWRKERNQNKNTPRVRDVFNLKK